MRIIGIIFLITFLFAFLSLTGSAFAQQPLELEYPEIMGETLEPGVSFPEYVRYIFFLSLVIGTLIAFGSLIYGGFRYVASGARPAALADAKDQMFAGILGLIILFSAYLILATINPQFLILTLPDLETPDFVYTPPPEQEKKIIAAQEIPLGALINSSSTHHFYSDYQGISHPKRIERLKLVSEKASEAVIALIPLMADLEKESKILRDFADDDNTDSLKWYAKQLRDKANNCNCGPPNCTACCGDVGCGSCACSPPNCACSGDPCPDRDLMNILRTIIEIKAIPDIQNQQPIVAKMATTVDVFTGAFEAFVKKNKKVDEFVNNNQEDIDNFLSTDLQKLIYEMQDLENTTTSHDYILSDGSSFSTPDYFHLRYEPEKEENDIESNKIYLRKAIDELIRAEIKTKECSNRRELMSYNNFYQYKEYKEKLEIIKEIEVAHWPGTTGEPENVILPGSDNATFYCSKYGPGVILTQEGTYCTIEIPIGEAVDMAEDLGEKIYIEIEKIFESGRTTTNNGFTAVSAARDQIKECDLEIEQAQKPGPDNDLIDLTSPGADRTKDCVDSCPDVPCTSACIESTGGCCAGYTDADGNYHCTDHTKYCKCQICKGSHPCPITQINNLFSSLKNHYNNVNSDYQQILIAYEYVRDICQPHIQDGAEKINSEKVINGFTIEERLPEIQEKLAESRIKLDECFTSLVEWKAHYPEKVLKEILVDCETAKAEYLKEEDLVNNCYGFDIDHPYRMDNFLCCETE